MATSGLCSGIDTHPTSSTKFGSSARRRHGGGGCSKEQREGDGLQNYLGVTLKIEMEIIKLDIASGLVYLKRVSCRRVVGFSPTSNVMVSAWAKTAWLAQSVERKTFNLVVVGSIPTPGTKFFL